MSSKEVTLRDILESIDSRIAHIEDITADNRTVIIKLVKQSNQIVKFLKQLDIETEVDLDYESVGNNFTSLPSLSHFPISEAKQLEFKHIKELIDEYLDKRKDLKELEEELRKNKDKLTPGQIGES